MFFTIDKQFVVLYVPALRSSYDSDLPLIPILSVYTSNLAKYRFFPLKLREIHIFGGLPKVFPYTFLIHTDFFPKILIFQVIYTDFVSGHSGRSDDFSWFGLRSNFGL